MSLKTVLLWIGTIIGALPVSAQLYEGKTTQLASVEQVVEGVQPGSVVFLGENHGLAAHRDQHLVILNKLREKGLKVSVGLEFLNYPDQLNVDAYINGKMEEADFLKKVGWGGISFDYYRPQLRFPDQANGEFSLALNLPKFITSKISKQGLESLTPEEMALMPPNFEVGRDSYKKRFAEAAGAHCPNLDRCFTAQSAWDDTMAWQAEKFINAHPDQVLVIVVGEFHVQYGGGFPHRFQQRNPCIPIRTVSQIWAEGYTDEEIQSELQPSVEEGPRADFIWVSKPE